MNFVSLSDYSFLFPAGAAVVAALITGFGAAALKRRWDVKDEQIRWLREREERTRKQRLDAFVDYLAARPTLAAVREVSQPSRVPRLFNHLEIVGIRLQLLLEESAQQDVIRSDLRAVEKWLTDLAANIDDSNRWNEVPHPKAVIEIARSAHGTG